MGRVKTAGRQMEFLTLSKSMELLRSRDINIRKYLGQHFLIDRNCRDKILSFADFNEGDTVVEIGPGLGALTDGFVEKVKDVYAFEIDPAFCEILRERFGGFGNFHLMEKDFLEIPGEWWDRLPGRVKVIGNTPYYISSPIVFRILELRRKVGLALLTVQKEVGERFTAVHGNKNYGAISVLMSIYADAKICYSLKRDVFFPRPEVSSVVVKIVPLENPEIDMANEKKFWEFLPLIFSFRRKKVSNVVNKIFKVEKKAFIRALENEDISPDERAEDLSPEKIYRIFRIINPTS